MNENVNSGFKYCKVLYKNGILGHCEEHINLPDYYPKISNIICCDARIYTTDYNVTDGMIDLNGTADAFIIYMGDNGELVPISKSINISEKMPVKNMTDDAQVMVTLTKDNVSAKGSGSHTEIKCNYRMEICVVGNDDADTDISPDAEVKSEKRTIMRLCFRDRKNTYIEEDIVLTAQDETPKRLLFNNGHVSVDECKVVTGKVIAKGTLHIYAVYENTSGGISVKKCDIPFNRVFDGTLSGENAKAVCSMELSDLKMEMYDDNTGENRIIACEANVICDAELYEENEEEIPVDAFSYEAESTVEKEEELIITDIVRECADGKFSASMQLDDNIRSIEMVYADPVIDGAVRGENNAAVAGNINVNILALDSEGKMVYKQITTPFEIVFESSPGCRILKAGAYTDNVDYNISSAGELTVTGNICAFYMCALEESVSYVSAMIESAEKLTKRKAITVYYPEKGQSWWDIAKRFHVDKNRLCRDNGDTEIPGKAVIIPRK